MRKSISIFGAAVLSLALIVPSQSANAACEDQFIWVHDTVPNPDVAKKYSTDGTLLQTVTFSGGDPGMDIALSSDLTKFMSPVSSSPSDKVLFWDSTSGASLPALVLSGFRVEGSGAGLVSAGTLLTDISSGTSTIILSVDLASGVSTEFFNLRNVDANLDVANRNGEWEVAGDMVRLPNGDILVVATNNKFPGSVVLVRLNSAGTSGTVVGTVVEDPNDRVYSAARAGDDIFLGTQKGSLLKLGTIPTSASVAAVSSTAIVTGTGSSTFSGAAGSNDFTNASVPCASAAPVVPESPAADPAPSAPAADPAASAPAADSAPVAASAKPVLATTGPEKYIIQALLGGTIAVLVAGIGTLVLLRRREEKLED